MTIGKMWQTIGGDGSRVIGSWDEVLDRAAELEANGIGWMIAGISKGATL